MRENKPPQTASDSLHVAIIMDGNGRWATQRGVSRAIGHQKGVETLRNIIESARALGIGYLTVYSFSTENWSRPEAEISALFQLLRDYVKKDLARLHHEEVCVRILGARANLPTDILDIISKVESTTAKNKKFNFNIAFNYGSRNELLRAIKTLMMEGTTTDCIDEAAISARLDTAASPDPDLVIRTSGEQRLSNFLLWQCAYSEFFFTQTLWPEFSVEEFAQIITEFRQRSRRFGGVTPSEIVTPVNLSA